MSAVSVGPIKLPSKKGERVLMYRFPAEIPVPRSGKAANHLYPDPGLNLN
jgi:hypothetical protein